MTILVLDAYNLIYRAKSGFTKGENAVVFMFFRSLRALIEKFNPDNCYFVLEGMPKQNIENLEAYKSNRPSQDDDFHRQKKIIINMIKSFFPITTVRHPDYECDDIAANIARREANTGRDVIVVSSDTDFIQILQWETLGKISLYNPVKKEFIKPPEYDYVKWKCIRGDKTDNIDGLPKFGDKTAEKYVQDKNLYESLFENKQYSEILERNKKLIELSDISCLDDNIELTSGIEFKKEEVFNVFSEMKFSSLTEDKYFKNFTCTFEKLCLL